MEKFIDIHFRKCYYNNIIDESEVDKMSNYKLIKSTAVLSTL